jgi:hypothetical protein
MVHSREKILLCEKVCLTSNVAHHPKQCMWQRKQQANHQMFQWAKGPGMLLLDHVHQQSAENDSKKTEKKHRHNVNDSTCLVDLSRLR